MRSTINHGRAGKIFIATVLAASLSSTGCSRVMNWADRMGDHMPTYSGQRCEDRNLCWKGEQTTTATTEEMQQRRRAANPNRQLPPGPLPWPDSTPASAASSAPVSAPADAGQQAPGMMQQPAMAPSATAMPDADMPPPIVRLPKNAEEAKHMAEQGQAIAPGGIPVEDAPPGMPKEMLEGNQPQQINGLKPYEQNPPWKDDNPPVPVLEQMKEQGW